MTNLFGNILNRAGPPTPRESPPATLTRLHNHEPGSVRWSATLAGVGIEGLAPVGTPGTPLTVRRILAWFATDLQTTSAEFSISIGLLVALIACESAGAQTDLDAVCNARREEPGFISDLDTPNRVSIGCCQTLISTARQALQMPWLCALDLADPSLSIRAAAAYIRSQASLHNFDPPLVAACYNAGGLYHEDSPTNRWRLRCYPEGTGRYIDRFVAYYNDFCALSAKAA